MDNINLKPCPFCGKSPIIETWRSGGVMFMVKCNNPVCPIPINGYPTGHDLDQIKNKWNRRAKND